MSDTKTDEDDERNLTLIYPCGTFIFDIVWIYSRHGIMNFYVLIFINARKVLSGFFSSSFRHVNL